jgi:hypothetical protein
MNMALSVVASFGWIVSGSASITIVIEAFGWTFAPAAVAGLAAGAAAGTPGAAGAAGLAASLGLAGAAVGAEAAGAQATARTLVINTRLAARRHARHPGCCNRTLTSPHMSAHAIHRETGRWSGLPNRKKGND